MVRVLLDLHFGRPGSPVTDASLAKLIVATGFEQVMRGRDGLARLYVYVHSGEFLS